MRGLAAKMDATSTGNSQTDFVSDTALRVTVYRAMESKRKGALFNDPFAETLAG